MRVLFFLSLVGAYRIETVTTNCFFVTKDCFKTHATEVEKEINQMFNKQNYISHTTSMMYKYGAVSMITYKD